MSVDFFPQVQGSKTLELAAKLDRDFILQSLIYRGVTETAAPTEIFIDNETNYRLQIPKNSVALVTWKGAAFNMTDGIGTVHGDFFVGVGQFSCKRADTGFVVGSVAISGTGFVFTLDDTLDAVKCTVTGAANKRILWTCKVDIVGVSGQSAPFFANPAFSGIQ